LRFIDRLGTGVRSGCLTALLLPVAGIGQQMSLTLQPGSRSPQATSATVEVFLRGNASLPSGLEWTFRYPSNDFASVDMQVGPSAVRAGKSITCTSSAGSVRCLIVGMNANPIETGVVATITIRLATAPPDAIVRVQIADVVAAAPDGTSISIQGRGALIETGRPRGPRHRDTGLNERGADVVPYQVRGALGEHQRRRRDVGSVS